MTFIGRILVWVQVVLSLVFLALAMGLYFQRTNWNDGVTPDGDKILGQVTELKNRINQLTAARDTAEPRYDTFQAELKSLESDRPKRQAFYDEQLAIVATGVDAQKKAVSPPVQELVMQGDRLDLRKTGRPPVQINGEPALSLKGYADKIAKVYEDVKSEQATIARLVAEADALTKKIAGTVPPEDAVTAEEKGLRGQLADWKRYGDAAKLEKQFLLTPMTNYTVEVELLKQRKASLEKRLNELAPAVSRLGS